MGQPAHSRNAETDPTVPTDMAKSVLAVVYRGQGPSMKTVPVKLEKKLMFRLPLESTL